MVADGVEVELVGLTDFLKNSQKASCPTPYRFVSNSGPTPLQGCSNEPVFRDVLLVLVESADDLVVLSITSQQLLVSEKPTSKDR